MDYSGTLTIALWIASIAVGAIVFTKARRTSESPFDFLMRTIFGLVLALTIWVCSTYGLWLAGMSLKIGAITNGRMAENWWLPFACLVMTILIRKQLRK